MTVKQGAAYLGISEATFDRYIVELGLPCHRFQDSPKSHRRVYQSEIDQWLRSRCSDNTPAQEAAS